MSTQDPRRAIPRTDTLLAQAPFVGAAQRHGREVVRAAITTAQQHARSGEIAPDEVADAAIATLPSRTSSLTPVLNATGVVVHPNIGRAPLSPSAIEAVVDAAGYVDVEMDLASGARTVS